VNPCHQKKKKKKPEKKPWFREYFKGGWYGRHLGQTGSEIDGGLRSLASVLQISIVPEVPEK
jgi:hypothetical protein